MSERNKVYVAATIEDLGLGPMKSPRTPRSPVAHNAPLHHHVAYWMRRQHRWLHRMARSIMRRYHHISWSTRKTIGVVISLYELLFIALSVPLRIGFLYDPFGSRSKSYWSDELSLFSAMDVVADVIGLYDFYCFYELYRDTFSQLSRSVSFEIGKKLQKQAHRAKPMSPTHRMRKASSIRRSSMAKWTLTALAAPSAGDNNRKRSIEFLLEVVAVIPFEVLALAVHDYNALHLIRLTKLTRLYRVSPVIDRLSKIYSDKRWVQRLSFTGISTLVKTISTGMLMSHWFACMYMLIANIQCGVMFEFCNAEVETSWVIRDKLMGATFGRKYGRSIYWASRTLVLLGYDDVTPVSNVETIYVLIVQVIGAVMSTSILATFLFIFRYRNSRKAEFTAHVDDAREYMKSQGIPVEIRRKVMAYFTYAWNTHHSLDSEEALHSMPKHLQSKVIHTLKASRIKQVCFLMKESVEFVNSLALTLVHRVYSPNDVIMEPKVSAKMFFVIRGTVVLSAFDGDNPKECQTGDYFADICLLNPGKFEEKAVAKTFCELFVLEKASFDSTVSHFYRGKEIVAKERMAQTLVRYATQLKKTKKLLGLRGAERSVRNLKGGDTKIDAQASGEWRLPGSTFRVRWEIVRLFAILFVAFEVPYYIVFISNHDAQKNFLVTQLLSGRFVVSALVEGFFAADLALRSRVFAYLDPVVFINVVDPGMIFAAYKASGFYVDLLTVLPIALTMEAIRGVAEDYSWPFRLLRLLRMRHLLDLLQDLSEYFGVSSRVNLIVALVLGVTMMLHMVGCLWFEMSWIPVSSEDTSEFDKSGLTRQTCLEMATSHQNCSWVQFDCYGQIKVKFPLEDEESMYKSSFAYLRSLYWAVVALTGVGYGDIVAFSTPESYFAAMWIFVGGIINFGVVGAMSSTISNLLANEHHHVEKLNTLNHIMEHLGITQGLRAEIRRFYNHQFNSRTKQYESQLLSHLPDNLCYQISSLLHSGSTKRVILFSSRSDEFLEEVTGKFRHRTYQNGETFYLEGDTCKEFLVILHGRVNMFFQSRRAPVGALADDDCYGVPEFFLKKPHPASLVAASHVDASVMTREQFDVIARKFPEQLRAIKDQAYYDWLDDVSRLRAVSKNMERLKLKPHILRTTSMFYHKDAISQQVTSSQGSAEDGRVRAIDEERLRSRIKTIWGFILTFWNLYSAFFIIFRIAFYSVFEYSDSFYRMVWMFDLICDAFFVGDIYLKLYYFEIADADMMNVFSRKQIDARYRHSNRLYIDLVASVPLYYVNRDRKFLIAICRVPRLIRCRQLPAYLDELIVQTQQAFPSQNVSSYMSPMKLLMFLLLAAHFAACIFFWISEIECNSLPEMCWIHHDPLVHAHHQAVAILYIRSFYWALTTLALVGSREIVPRSALGSMWAGVTCLTCTFLMGHIIGELSELMLELDKEEKEYKSRIESFEHFAKEHDLPESLRTRVGFFFKVQFQHTQGKNFEETVHDLSANLRLKLMHEIYGSVIISLPISRFLTSTQVNNLALRLRSELFIPGDDIITEDTFGNRLCILKKGLAAVFWSQSVTNVAVLMEGCLFGEVAFFLQHQRRIATVKATTSCEVLHISKLAWQELWNDSSDISDEQVYKYALHSVLDWVKGRMLCYQENCLNVATRAKRFMMARKISANLKHMMAPTKKTKGGSGSENKEKNETYVTPEVLLLERKAKYLLAKTDAYLKKYLIQQHGASVHSTSSLTSAISSFGRNEESHKPFGGFDHHGGRNHPKGQSTTQPHAGKPSVATTAVVAHQLHQLKRKPVRAMDSNFKQFFAEVNPVNKYVRDHTSDDNLVDLEVESWRRYQVMSSLQHVIGRMMDDIIPKQRAKTKSVQQDPIAGSGPHKKKTPLLANNQDTRRVSNALAQMRGGSHPICKKFQLSPSQDPCHRLSVLGLMGDTGSRHSYKRRAYNVSITSVHVAVKRTTTKKKVLPTVKGRLAKLVDMSTGTQRALGSTIADQKSQAVSETGASSGLRRANSLPSFDVCFFEGVSVQEETRREKCRSKMSGIESTLQGHHNIDFEVLQRCRRPKFQTLFRFYRQYFKWKNRRAQQAVVAKTSGMSGENATSTLESKKPQRPSIISAQLAKLKTKRSENGSSHRRSVIRWHRAHHLVQQRRVQLNPDDFLRLVKKMGKTWDLLMLLISVYFALAAPLKVCFVEEFKQLGATSLIVWTVMEFFMDILCIVDIVHKLRNSSHLENSMQAMTKRNKLSYLLLAVYPDFFYDLVATLPLGIIMFGLYPVSTVISPAGWGHLSYFHLNRVIFAHRVQGLTESIFQYIVYDIKAPISEAVLYFFRSLMSYMLMGHWICCIWYAISFKGFREGDESWLSSEGMLVSGLPSAGELAHERRFSSTSNATSAAENVAQIVAHVSLGRKYLRSMHFAVGSITTLFYGDIISMSLLELGAEIAVILWSIYVYGTLVGAHGELLETHSSKKAIFEQNLTELQHYLAQNEVPKHLRKQIKQYYSSIWKRRHGEEEFEAIANVSRTLQEDVVYATLHRFAWKVSVFHSLEVHFLRALLAKFQYIVCSEDEEIVLKGDVDRCMYFISRGRVLVKNDKAEATKDKGDFFGELTLLYGVPHHDTCIALTACELYRVDGESFDKVLMDFPEYREKVKLEWTTAEPTTSVLTALLNVLKPTPVGGVDPATRNALSSDAVVMTRLDAPSDAFIEEQIPRTHIYLSMMELLSRLENLDVLEAKHIISHARSGSRKFLRIKYGLEKPQPRRQWTDPSLVDAGHASGDEVRAFILTAESTPRDLEEEADKVTKLEGSRQLLKRDWSKDNSWASVRSELDQSLQQANSESPAYSAPT